MDALAVSHLRSPVKSSRRKTPAPHCSMLGPASLSSLALAPSFDEEALFPKGSSKRQPQLVRRQVFPPKCSKISYNASRCISKWIPPSSSQLLKRVMCREVSRTHCRPVIGHRLLRSSHQVSIMSRSRITSLDRSDYEPLGQGHGAHGTPEFF